MRIACFLIFELISLLLWKISEAAPITIKGANNFIPCHYVQNAIIDCKYKSLDSIPVILPQGKIVKKILFGDSQISDITAEAFANLNETLTEILLEEIHITSISINSFKGLTLLKDLTIKVSREIDIYQQSNVNLKLLLRPLISLKSLTLSNLQVQTLPEDFLPSTTLTNIELDNTITGTIQPTAFKKGEYSLQNITLRNLSTLQNSGISLWLEYLKSLKSLIMESSKLEQFPSLPSNINLLQVLILSRNGIASIPSNALSGVSASLIHLDLSFNRLKDDNLSSLEILNNLEILDLSTNSPLTKIPVGVKNMNRLISLSMQRCSLVFLETNNFPTNSALKKLSISSNPTLTSLESEMFSRIRNLNTLDIDGANIPNILVDYTMGDWKPIFTKLTNLTHLRMGHCKLHDSFFEKLSFLPKKTILFLGLKSNYLTNIPKYFFANFNQILNLDLSDNNIKKINYSSFYGLPSILDSLRLENNKLETIDNCTFSSFLNFKDINLKNNPIICDCRLLWLLNNSKKMVDFKCFGPDSNKDKTFYSLSTQQLVCPGGKSPDPQCIIPNSLASSTTYEPSITTISMLYNILINTEYNKNNLWIRLSISERILKEFNNFTLTYKKINSIKTENVILWNPHISEVLIRNVDPGYNYSICVILWKQGKSFSYSYNCEIVKIGLIKNDVNLAAIIGGAVGGCIIFVIIIVIVVFKCGKKKPDSAEVNTTEESVYDYDYPSFHKVDPHMSTDSRLFVRARDSSVGGGTRTTMSTDFEVPFQRPHTNGQTNRNVQSTFNLPQHYNTSRLGSGQFHRQNFHVNSSRSMDWLDRSSDRIQGRHLPPRPESGRDVDFQSLHANTLPSEPVYPYEKMDTDSYYLGMQNMGFPSYQTMSPELSETPSTPAPRHENNPAAVDFYGGGGGPYSLGEDLSIQTRVSYPFSEPPNYESGDEIFSEPEVRDIGIF